MTNTNETTTGNGAKMREALKAAKQYLDGYTVNNLELRRMVDAALAEPPRNCDKFGTDNAEASLAYEEFCDRAEVEESVNGAISWLLSLDADKEGEATKEELSEQTGNLLYKEVTVTPKGAAQI